MEANENTIQEFLKNCSTHSLMQLALGSDAQTFADDSIVRVLVKKYNLSTTGEIFSGVIALRHLILVEITKRYFDNLN